MDHVPRVQQHRPVRVHPPRQLGEALPVPEVEPDAGIREEGDSGEQREPVPEDLRTRRTSRKPVVEQDHARGEHHRSRRPGEDRKRRQRVRQPEEQEPVPDDGHVPAGQHHRGGSREQTLQFLPLLADRRTLSETHGLPELLPELRVALHVEPVRGQDRLPRLLRVGVPIPFGDAEPHHFVRGLDRPPEARAVEPFLGQQPFLERPMRLGERRVPLEDAADPLADVERSGLAAALPELLLDFLQDGFRLPPAHRDGRHRTGRQLERLEAGAKVDPAGLGPEDDRAGDVGGQLRTGSPGRRG